MEQHRSPTRRLRIFLRDFRMVEAAVSLADGQSLASFFAMRKGYLNLREAYWPSTNERAEDAALKVEQVLWAASSGDDVPLTLAPAAQTGRSVEVQLDGGLLLRARLLMNNQQRLSDYLEAAGKFLPLTDAVLLRSGRPPQRVNVQLGDLVLNQESIQAAWETVAEPASEEIPTEHVVVQSLEETSISALDDQTAGGVTEAADLELTLDAVADIDDAAAPAADDWESEPGEAAYERRPDVTPSWQTGTPRW